VRIVIKHLKISNTKSSATVHEEKTVINNVKSVTIEEEEVRDDRSSQVS